MMLRGVPRHRIDALLWSDWCSIVAHCQSGLMGPLTDHVVGFRMASMIRELHRTVASALGGTVPPSLKPERDWPELAPFVESPPIRGPEPGQSEIRMDSNTKHTQHLSLIHI